MDSIPRLLRPYPVTSALSIRPCVLVLLTAWTALLAVLALAPIAAIPINDKILHFFGLGIATFLIYFTIHVPDASRRIWYFRRAPMILTLFLGFGCGGILSETIQGMVPWRTFEWLDIVANLAGATTAYILAHALQSHLRRKEHIARLYLPVTAEEPYAHPTQGRESRESVDTELGAWDAQRYYHRAPVRTGAVGTGAEGRTEVFDLGSDDEEADVK